MGTRAKVSVSLDPGIAARVESLRRRTGESRSAVVGRALARLLDAEAKAARVAEYVRAYRETPETVAEVRPRAARQAPAGGPRVEARSVQRARS